MEVDLAHSCQQGPFPATRLYNDICLGLGVTANGVVYHTSFYYGA